MVFLLTHDLQWTGVIVDVEVICALAISTSIFYNRFGMASMAARILSRLIVTIAEIPRDHRFPCQISPELLLCFYEMEQIEDSASRLRAARNRDTYGIFEQAGYSLLMVRPYGHICLLVKSLSAHSTRLDVAILLGFSSRLRNAVQHICAA